MKPLEKTVFIIAGAITLSVFFILAKAILFNYENLSNFTNNTLASLILLSLSVLGLIFLLSPLIFLCTRKRVIRPINKK